MSATTTSSAADDDATDDDEAKNTLDYNAFLQLLIAEMKNQDPTEPMKSSGLHGAVRVVLAASSRGSRRTPSSIRCSPPTALSQADALLGHTVTSADGTVSGVVKSLRLTSGGLVATLDNGKELTLGEGVTIS